MTAFFLQSIFEIVNKKNEKMCKKEYFFDNCFKKLKKIDKSEIKKKRGEVKALLARVFTFQGVEETERIVLRGFQDGVGYHIQPDGK